MPEGKRNALMGVAYVNMFVLAIAAGEMDWALVGVSAGLGAIVLPGIAIYWRNKYGFQPSANEDQGVDRVSNYYALVASLSPSAAAARNHPGARLARARARVRSRLSTGPLDGYAVGWREWQTLIEPGVAELRAMAMTKRKWSDTGWTAATCVVAESSVLHNPHPQLHDAAPVATCSCGLYVRSDWHRAAVRAAQIATLARDYPKYSTVLGVAMAKGRIVEHGRDGFRAEHARPAALAAEVNPERASVIAQAYEIPLIPMRDLRAYALKLGREPVTA